MARIVNVSVIIPCINEQADIGPAIDSVRATAAAEVLVADGGSRDDTPRIAAERGAIVIRCNTGRAVQMNRGAEVATGDVLLFLHADCRLASDSVYRVARAMADPKTVWGGFVQRIEANGWIYRAIEKGNAARARWQGLVYGDQAMFMRRSAFDQTGGFDSVPLLEDVLMSQKLRRVARPLLLESAVLVNPRRWRQRGPIRQTMHNWKLTTLFRFGVSPERLARSYRRHDA